jgi:dynein heavy chain
VDNKLSFAEIVVPTMDSVRNTYFLDLLVKQNANHVLMVGQTGTGKTVNISQFLGKLPDKFTPLTLTFSAQTSANQTQDIIDSKMDKRRKGVYGPTAGKQFVIYVDDLNMPKREKYFAQPPIEILRQWFDQGGWYDRKALAFRQLIDISFVSSMGPPGGGRNPVTPRFIRHFNVIGYTELADSSKLSIFETILANFMVTFPDEMRDLSSSLVDASIHVYNTICKELLPTPQRCHYTFNLRDLAKVFQGMLMGAPNRLRDMKELLRLWVHENKRVFADRLISLEDHAWFKALIDSELKGKFETAYDDIAPNKYLIYGDFLQGHGGNSTYEEIVDMEQLQSCVEEYLADFNAETKTPMPLVMFLDAIEHVSRISRILRQPQGNALLLGVGGSGRQSLTRLATYMAEYTCFQVEISKGYGVVEWREDVKRCLLLAGIENKPVVFLFSDVQIVDEIMLEDINNVLNAGDVPNIYNPEDLDSINTACRADCQRKGIPPTKLNVFSQYILRVRKNIHVVLAMSPIGDAFRNRLRMFPALANCCTIDWFTEWPAEALNSVAHSILSITDLNLGDNLNGIVEVFKMVHMTVEQSSKVFLEKLRRRYYVTPTSYLELLSTFKAVLQSKRTDVITMRDRLQNGVDKIAETKKSVAIMQQELVELQPQLKVTQEEVEKMMVTITIDKASADETRTIVEKEEEVATAKAAATKAIADDAQADLDEALPALEAAVQCLSKLKKADIDEVKAFSSPSSGVRLTMEAACIMFEVKPVKKNDPENPGKKIIDYWDAAKSKLLSDAKAMMTSMREYDKDHIPARVIKQIAPYMEMDEFTPAAVERSSKACTAICMWVRAMHTYNRVALAVEPKKKALAGAQIELDETLGKLKDAQDRLKGVVDKLAELEKNYNGAVDKKEALALQVEQCEIRLESAQKLIGGLGGEETRWRATCLELNDAFDNLIGDALISAGSISYTGAFTTEYRDDLVDTWRQKLVEVNIAHTPGCNVTKTLAVPVEVRAWQLAGLPADSLSVENGIIMNRSRRWPLFIDPQGQANRFVKNLGKDMSENGLDVIKLTNKNFLRTLENGVRFGKWVLLENIQETLDASIEPILLQQKFKQGGQEMIRIGDSTIPYNNSFKFFMTTKMPNPHYPPEVCVKVTLLNFTITMTGLEEQLLGMVVQEEMPELAERKNVLVVSNAKMKKELHDIENQILYLLSHSEGNILDDTELIQTLAKAKETSEEINIKMAEAEVTEKEIDATRENYRIVAYRGALLFFCIADLAAIDPMYQYSLPWFQYLFTNSINKAPKSDELEERLVSLKDSFTFGLYNNVSQSLFASHKLLLSFLMTIKILQGENLIDPVEWRFLISGLISGDIDDPMENPDHSWIDERMWTEISRVSSMPAFKGLNRTFESDIQQWRALFDSAVPHTMALPAPFDESLNSFQKMCVLRCLRPDKGMEAVHEFVREKMGVKYTTPPPLNLAASYSESSVLTPLIFVLSPGSDPAKDLIKFAEEMRMGRKLTSIALGQGQGVLAAKMVAESIVRGSWVLLQNCHLSISWMPELEKICEDFEAEKMHRDFRLWLTSMPTPHFPASVLQNGVKMTNEPPKGLRANLSGLYFKMNNEQLDMTTKPKEYKKLLFGLSFFHANIIERKQFGPLGWNIPYGFNDTDYDICKSQLQLFLDTYDEVPYQVLHVMTSLVNYGGRITDDKDMRTIDVVLRTFFSAPILTDEHKFSRSGKYYSIPFDDEDPYASYTSYIDSLPVMNDPEIFGMHENANITCQQVETFHTFDIILSLQPRVSSGEGEMTREEQIDLEAKRIENMIPGIYNIREISKKFPVTYEESMNTVLVQEAQKYNNLLSVMISTLAGLQKAIKGLVVMSSDLEEMANCLFDQKVPPVWEAKAYPSLKPLGPWVTELLQRVGFMQDWIDGGTPSIFWIAGFFFPQAFFTGTLQNSARKYIIPIDTLSFCFKYLAGEISDFGERPPDGCYVHGLFIEGARWDKKAATLTDSRPKELFSLMPVMHFVPEQDRQETQSGIYRCPVYKILTRTGILSTTGHSTNFVTWIEIPSGKPTIFRNSLVSETNAQIQLADSDYWACAGVACFCSLRF